MKHTLRGLAESREVWLDGKWLSAEESIKYRNHSPDGFNWGYGGSGPAQLALAIILKLSGKEDGYQNFKEMVVAPLPMGKDFEMEFEFWHYGKEI